ncbi:MAG TPA: AraC family transcriptional regulator [Cyclobacteriaceae bacterium]|nr:AraC family transcriptional regulator [Cyclobacteriaceae bacterium]
MDIRLFFALGIIQSLFLAVVIGVSGKQLAKSQRLLILWLGTLIMNFYFYWISFSGSQVGFDFLVICWGIEILQGPLIYIYTQSVLNDELDLRPIDLVHLIPYSAVLALVLCVHYLTANTVTISNGYIIFKDGAPLALKVLVNLTKLITLTYIGVSLYKVLVRARGLSQYHSNPERIHLAWLRLFLLGIGIGDVVLYLAIPDMLGFYMLSDYQIAALSTFVGVAFSYLASFVNYRHQFELNVMTASMSSVGLSSNQLVDETATEVKYRNSGLTEAKALELSYALNQYMNETKPYLNKNLTLRDVADELNLTPNTVSQVINNCMKKNFFEFINEFRVLEFKKNIRLGQHDNYTILAVAQECGFASKSTFYSTFKKITGQTPADFVKSHSARVTAARLADIRS